MEYVFDELYDMYHIIKLFDIDIIPNEVFVSRRELDRTAFLEIFLG